MTSGLQRERPGDADALPLAAGELVRVAVDVLGVQADARRAAPGRAARAIALRRHLGVDLERLADDVADRHPRVQRRVRVLHDHLDVAAQPAQLASRTSRTCPGPRSTAVPAVGFSRPHQQLGQRGLAAAGLADDAERLALLQLEADAVDRLDRADLLLEDDAAGDREVLDQVLDPDDRLGSRGASDIAIEHLLGEVAGAGAAAAEVHVRRHGGRGRSPGRTGSAGGTSSRTGCASGSAAGP